MKLSRISSIASRQSFTVFFLLSLFTFHFSLFTSPVRAYDPPNSQPCQNSQETPFLTSNYIIDESGEPPQGLRFEVTKSGQLGDTFSETFEATYQVDFSKLQSIFGPANSNYLEGKVQSEQQRTSNIFTLNKSDFNKFHGPQQKATPKIITDEQKVKYVKYILDHPTLPEASNQYTNTKGQNKKTIYNLIQDGFPSNPKPPSMGGNQEEWLTNWGKYWEKIPTAYREFYNGYLNFNVSQSDTFLRWAEGELTQSDREKLEHLTGATIGDVSCLPLARDPIRFVMPEFSRTVSVSDSLNKVVVPCAAQSWRHAPQGADKLDECKTKPESVTSENNNNNSLLAKALNICKKIILSPQNAVQKIKNAVKVSFKLLNPLKDTYAETPPCLVKLPEGAKEGSAPFCALPNGQLTNDDRCIDKPSENKLDKENKNVICEFKISYTIEFKIDPNSPQWNSCEPEGGDFRCSTVVRIFPDFKIPFITEIWNNTTYSENQGGTSTNQKTGRPGIYSTFIPKTLFEEDISRETLAELQKGCPGGLTDISSDPQCTALADILDQLRIKYPDIEAQTGECNITTSTQLDQCIGRYFGRILSKSQPGKSKTETGEQKQRFIGAADCNKFVARDLSLKPKALQKYQGITGIAEECLLQTSAVAVTGPVDFDDQQPPDGDGGPPIPDDCSNVSGDDPSTPARETSRDELVCYIVSRANGITEEKTGDPLDVVMIKIMDAESSGDQCAAGTYGEIGVFQYIAGTWKGGTIAPLAGTTDSGSGSITARASGKIGCWRDPGPDPISIADNRPIFSWPAQFGFGTTNDGGAWNPYWQIDNTVDKIQADGSPCAWSSVDYIDPDTGERRGLYPFLCNR